MKTLTALGLCTVLSTAAFAQNFNIPPPPQREPIVLKDVALYPVSGAPIERGAIRFEGGRITAIGSTVDESGAKVESLTGLRVYPGLIDANSAVGLFEIDAVRATVDTSEVGPFNPNVRAEVAVNPDSEQFAVSRANGVLVSLVVPQSGGAGVVTGRSALIQHDGWTWERMTVRAPVGLHISWPVTTLPPWLPAPIREEAIKAAKSNLTKLDALFADARRYRAEGDNRRENLRLEALLPALDRKLPVYFHVQEQGQIRAALKFAERENLSAVLVGAIDAWRLTTLIKAANVPVIIGGTHIQPLRRDEAYDEAYTLPKKLHAAGIPFAIAMPGDTFSTSLARNLPYHAAMAASFGLPADVALRSITLSAAEIVGAADRLGSLDRGKDATLILTDGDPLEIRTQVLRAFVMGREISLNNRQRELNRKYTEKYQQE
jgi:imidazolonepropionase-like amidohydrolase